jgi:hypothetical protein
MSEKPDEHYDKAETASRENATLKRLLATPPQPKTKKDAGEAIEQVCPRAEKRRRWTRNHAVR